MSAYYPMFRRERQDGQDLMFEHPALNKYICEVERPTAQAFEASLFELHGDIGAIKRHVDLLYPHAKGPPQPPYRWPAAVEEWESDRKALGRQILEASKEAQGRLDQLAASPQYGRDEAIRDFHQSESATLTAQLKRLEPLKLQESTKSR